MGYHDSPMITVHAHRVKQFGVEFYQASFSAKDIDRLVKQAQQAIADYERLTAEGKHREAGEKLDQLKQVLAELSRTRGGM